MRNFFPILLAGLLGFSQLAASQDLKPDARHDSRADKAKARARASSATGGSVAAETKGGAVTGGPVSVEPTNPRVPSPKDEKKKR